jgi:hypothetical protein
MAWSARKKMRWDADVARPQRSELSVKNPQAKAKTILNP